MQHRDSNKAFSHSHTQIRLQKLEEIRITEREREKKRERDLHSLFVTIPIHSLPLNRGPSEANKKAAKIQPLLLTQNFSRELIAFPHRLPLRLILRTSPIDWTVSFNSGDSLKMPNSSPCLELSLSYCTVLSFELLVETNSLVCLPSRSFPEDPIFLLTVFLSNYSQKNIT